MLVPSLVQIQSFPHMPPKHTLCKFRGWTYGISQSPRWLVQHHQVKLSNLICFHGYDVITFGCVTLQVISNKSKMIRTMHILYVCNIKPDYISWVSKFILHLGNSSFYKKERNLAQGPLTSFSQFSFFLITFLFFSSPLALRDFPETTVQLQESSYI